MLPVILRRPMAELAALGERKLIGCETPRPAETLSVAGWQDGS